MNRENLSTIRSGHTVQKTIDRLAAIILSKGLIAFARIDHAKGAHDAGLELRPTELLLFGHPKGGTPLMQDRQTAGLDLPVRALAWEDESGAVWLSYHTGSWIASVHELSLASGPAVEAIDQGIAAVCALAAGDDAAEA